MTPARWQALMHALGLAENANTLVALGAAYREPQRFYHTQAHITDCLDQFERLREQAQRPNEIELAIWFHDAIYRPHRSDNERRSADWASRFLRDSGASADVADRVSGLILATRHAIVPVDPDTAILIDVDLSILAADADRYAQFEADVRREYRWVPRFVYRRKRAAILASFLQRSRIYATDLFHARYEAPARRNLRAAIDSLS
jgi:predicted metal-dependent HD superfamily phosphohydrolase